MKSKRTVCRDPFGGWCTPEHVFRTQSTALAIRLDRIGVETVAVGISGGLDSTLCLLVADEAFRLLRLPAKNIRAFSMPGFGTTRRTKGNAERICEGLGVSFETIDITRACRRHFKDIGHDPSVHDVVFENAQARMRTMILMNKANQTGGIVLGTGDMSEIALGWSTYNGDHMSMFGVNAGVPKTAVRSVCRWWAGNASRRGKRLAAVAAAVMDVVDTPVSPELLPARRGKIVQKTEDRIGPYELHDFFIWRTVACGEKRDRIQAAAERAFSGVYAPEEIAKWLEVFCRRLVTQSFKRNCAPDGIKVYPVYFGPDDWHIPSDTAYRGDIVQPDDSGKRK